METLINSFFHDEPLDGLAAQVKQGDYHLVGPNGKIIARSRAEWDQNIQPGWRITMRMEGLMPIRAIDQASGIASMSSRPPISTDWRPGEDDHDTKKKLDSGAVPESGDHHMSNNSYRSTSPTDFFVSRLGQTFEEKSPADGIAKTEKKKETEKSMKDDDEEEGFITLKVGDRRFNLPLRLVKTWQVCFGHRLDNVQKNALTR